METLIDLSLSGQFDRLPPHSIEAEQCALGSLLLCGDDKAAFDLTRSQLRTESFYLADHGIVFDVVCAMADRGRAIDGVLVAEELKRRQLLDEIGGVSQLAAILNSVPSYAHGPHYASVVREKAILRGIISASNDALRACYAPGASATDVALKFTEELAALARTGSAATFCTLGQALEELLDRKTSDDVPRIPTGLADLDEVIGGLPLGEFTLIGGRPSMGKAQPLTAKVLTPTGWRYMAEISVGDDVIGGDGLSHKVTGVFPQGRKEVFSVRFTDGGRTLCCDDHLWLTRTRNDRRTGGDGSVKPMREIRGTLTAESGKRLNHGVPYVRPVEFPKKNLPLDPYVLGVFLGDGDTANGCFSITNTEDDVRERVAGSMPDGDVMTLEKRRIRAKRKVRANAPSDAVDILKTMGLFGCGSAMKFIPKEYLLSSVADRVWLLRGLVDTDGYVTDPAGSGIEYTTVSAALREDIVFLVQSLGGRVTWDVKKAGYRKGDDYVECSDAYRMNISFHNEIIPVSSEKHRRKFKGVSRRTDRFIEAVERYSDGPVHCQCIAVDSADHLYVTDDFIVTHNSQLAKQALLNIARKGRKVALVTVEETREKVAENMLSNAAGVENNRIAFGTLGPQDWNEIGKASPGLTALPFHIDDVPLRLDEVAEAVTVAAVKHRCEVVVVDYLQLIDPGQMETENREITKISRCLKGLAKRLRIALVAVCQLNRGNESSGVRRPTLRDLRGSGSLEQDGDLIILLHREDYYRYQEPGYIPNHHLEAIVAKNKKGCVGTVRLHFSGKTQSITDWRPI